MNLLKAVFVLCFCASSLAQLLAPAGKLPEFDVASVRRDKTDVEPDGTFPLGPGDLFVANSGSFTFRNFPLLQYLAFAYKMTPNGLLLMQRNLPEWVVNERFDIQAKTERTGATKDDVRLMMRALLMDRFHLVVREETKTASAYELQLVTAGAAGPRLVPHSAGVSCTGDLGTLTEDTALPKDGLPPVCGANIAMPPTDPRLRRIAGRGVPVETLMKGISNWGSLGRPVVNKTGLTGTFDFQLEYQPEPEGGAAAGAVDYSGPTLQAALAKQLGLKLVSTKSDVTALVIERVERPGEN